MSDGAWEDYVKHVVETELKPKFEQLVERWLAGEFPEATLMDLIEGTLQAGEDVFKGRGE
jgi:hypothetical protein